jgi:hypothetical protein
VRKPYATGSFANAKGCLQHGQRRLFLVGLAMPLIGAVLFSGKAILVKLLYRHQVDAMTVLVFIDDARSAGSDVMIGGAYSGSF